MEWAFYVESNPDRWYRYEVYQKVDAVRARVASYIGADPEDVVFVENASHGVNSILRSVQMTLGAGSKILILDLAYCMVKNTCNFLHDSYKTSIVEVPITFPTDNSKILETVRQALDSDPSIALASFSHITSIPSIILPVKELAALCHSKNVLVLIDGAHVMGQIPLNVTELGADFYITNGHKWMYTPKGSAVLWVRKDKQNIIFPTTISGGGQGVSPFQKAFSYLGTGDYSSYLCFEEAFLFRNEFGDDTLIKYIHNLAVEGGALLAQMWGTEKLIDDSMIGAMVNVRIPSTDAAFLEGLPKLILGKYNTYANIFPLKNSQLWYVRVSAQIYTELSDFQMLGNVILSLLKEREDK